MHIRQLLVILMHYGFSLEQTTNFKLVADRAPIRLKLIVVNAKIFKHLQTWQDSTVFVTSKHTAEAITQQEQRSLENLLLFQLSNSNFNNMTFISLLKTFVAFIHFRPP